MPSRDRQKRLLERQRKEGNQQTEISHAPPNHLIETVSTQEILTGEAPIALLDLVCLRLKTQFRMQYGLLTLSYLHAKQCAQEALTPIEVIPPHVFAVQIHYIDHHYVVSYQRDRQIVVLDSLRSPNRVQRLFPQLQMLYSAIQHGSVRLHNILYGEPQNQMATVDCGPFAIANAYTVLSHKDPFMFRFMQRQMRHHIKRCLDMNLFIDFPLVRLGQPSSRPQPSVPQSWAEVALQKDPLTQQLCSQLFSTKPSFREKGPCARKKAKLTTANMVGKQQTGFVNRISGKEKDFGTAFSSEASRKAIARQMRTPEQKARDRSVERERKSCARQTRSEEELAKDKASNRKRMVSARQTRSEEELAKDRSVDRGRKSCARQTKSEEELAKDRSVDRGRKSCARQTRSEEELAKDRSVDRGRKSCARQTRSEEELAKDNSVERGRKSCARQTRSEEELAKDRSVERGRKSCARQTRSEEELAKDKASNRKRMVSARQTRSEEEVAKDRSVDSGRKSSARKTRTNEQLDRDRVHDVRRKLYARQEQSLEEHLQTFQKEINKGPTFICGCCRRLMYETSVRKVTGLKLSSVDEELRKLCVGDTGWMCSSCSNTLKKNKMPAMCTANKLKVDELPAPLKSLTDLEARIIAQRIPFMKILNLPVGKQRAVVGTVVNVPIDVSTTCASLPRSTTSSTGFIPLKLKRKQEYTGHVLYQTVRPQVIENALKYLREHNPLYSDIILNPTWQEEFLEDDEDLWHALTSEDNGMNSEETQPEALSDKSTNQESNSVMFDTCVQPEDAVPKGNEVFSIAPGEGRHPLPIMKDKDNEVLTFPQLFPNGQFGFDVNRKVHLPLRKYFQCRLLNGDTRFAKNTEYVFYAQYLTEFKQVHDAINVALRKARLHQLQSGSVSAGLLKNRDKLMDFIRHDQGYQFLKNVRGSPAYCKKILYDLLAMIRCLGPFTWFVTLSAADLKWPDTLCVIARQNNISLDPEDVKKMSWEERSSLIRQNPVTAARHFDHRVQQFVTHVLKQGVIGPVADYLYRVEFQQRGSPHIHMAVWVEGAPTFDTSTDDKLTSFIDTYVRCSVPQNEDAVDLVSLQRHCHSATCKKTGKTCRFAFPRPPCDHTLICRKKDACDPSVSQISMTSNTLKLVFTAMSNLDVTETTTLDAILQEANITSAQYHTALRDSKSNNAVIHSRSPQDIFINNYNEDILRVWQANMDIQFVADPYACVMYIASYMTKAEHEMGELLSQVAQQAAEAGVQQQLRRVGNKFLHAREVSAQEAVYRILSLPLTKNTRDVLYVPTEASKDRTYLLKPMSTIDQMEDDDEDVYQMGYVDRYAKRPDSLQDMCMSHFVSQYRVDYSGSQPSADQELSGKKITLLDGAGVMVKRLKHAICRTHRYSLNKDPEKHYHGLLMMYVPWRNEDELKHEDGTYCSRYNELSELITQNQSQVEKNQNSVNQALDDLEQLGPPEDTWDRMMSESQHQRHTEREQGAQEAEEYAVLNPDGHSTARQGQSSTFTPCISVVNTAILSDFDYLLHLRSLNSKQRDILDLFVNHCFSIQTSVKTGTVPEPIHVFISGSAGTGKSHLIKALYQMFTKVLVKEGNSPDDTVCLLAAPTGTAANNIHGQTVHGALQLSVMHKYSRDSVSHQTLSALRNKYSSLKCIIVDEVSMLGANGLTRVHKRLCDIRGSVDDEKLFGGVSFICFGDLQQLPPVLQPPVFGLPSSQMDRLNSPLWDNVAITELTEIMRQKNDLEFANLLRRVRNWDSENADQKEMDLNILKSRIIDGRNIHYPKDTLHVFATNDLVDNYNDNHLKTTGRVIYSIPAQDSKVDDNTNRVSVDIPSKASQTSGLRSVVDVSLHARIMITKNIDVCDGLVNGMQGTVVGFYPDPPDVSSTTYRPVFIIVNLDDPSAGRQARQTYHSILNNYPTGVPVKMEEAKFRVGKYQVAEVTRRQFPITLAWACTIHKVQGMTLNSIVISCKRRFNPGQFYVAVSRVKSLNGLYFLDFDENKILTNKEASSAEQVMKLTRPLETIDVWTSESENEITLSLLNINSLKCHLQDIQVDKHLLSSDVLALTETWLNPSMSSVQYSLEGFHMARQDRHFCYTQQLSEDSRKHGGVLQYVSTRLDLESFQHEIRNLEFLHTLIRTPDGTFSFHMLVIYRPPWNTLQNFYSNLERVLCLMSSGPSVVLGDFNVNADGKGKPLKDLTTLMNRYEYLLIETAPTHTSGSRIDLVFVKNLTVLKRRSLPRYYTQHTAVQLQLSSAC